MCYLRIVTQSILRIGWDNSATLCSRVGNERAVELLVKDCRVNIEARNNREGTVSYAAFERGLEKEIALL